MSIAPLPTDDDPPPVEPVAPEPEECCGNGCDPCIFDFYAIERERYFEQLRAWRARQAARDGSAPPAAP